MWFHNLSLYLLFQSLYIYGHLFSLISHCAGSGGSRYYCPFSPGMIWENQCKCWIREYINIKKMRFKWTLDHSNPTFAVRIIIPYVDTGVYWVQVCCVGGVTQRGGARAWWALIGCWGHVTKVSASFSQERVDGAVTDSDQFLLFSYYAVGQKEY